MLCAIVTMANVLVDGRGPQAPAAAPQPEFTTLKADFVPGEKTLFFDDFTDMGPGDAPPHFKTRGAAPELQASGALRQLAITGPGSIFPNLTSLPKNFTYEAEAKFDVPRGTVQTYISFLSKDREALTWSVLVGSAATDLVLVTKVPKFEEFGRKRITVDWKQPVKLALWIQNGRLRAFVNGEKQLDINQVDIAPVDKIEMRTGMAGTGLSVGYRTIRFAESTPDFSRVIASAGRYVSYGIQFDTDSDRLKPESAAVLQAIAKGLETNSSLKLLIEGHTDAVGDAAHNLDLSKRRAAAVKGVLVSQFKVDTARLTTNGLGSTKPIGPNDTPQGRAQNRRVEFVRQ
jgi:outer membrane protein OmpA-like peptidoglycan-associated protein